MRYSNCNTELENGAKFCTECKKLRTEMRKPSIIAEKYYENEDYEKTFYWYEQVVRKGNFE